MRQVSRSSGEQLSWRETSVGAHRQAWQEPEGPKASQWMGTSHTSPNTSGPNAQSPAKAHCLISLGEFQGKHKAFGLNILVTPAACKVPREAFLLDLSRSRLRCTHSPEMPP